MGLSEILGGSIASRPLKSERPYPFWQRAIYLMAQRRVLHLSLPLVGVWNLILPSQERSK